MQAISRQSELFWLTMEREGFSPEPYKCSQGLWTIGFGHRVMGEGPGPNWLWTHEDAEEVLLGDLNRAAEQARELSVKQEVPWQYWRVLTLMCFQLGFTGTRGFRKMLDAMSDCDDVQVIAEMIDSRWAKQTPQRVFDAIGFVIDL